MGEEGTERTRGRRWLLPPYHPYPYFILISRLTHFSLLFQTRWLFCMSEPINIQCCSWIGPCGSYDCKMPSVINIRELWGKKQKRFFTHRSCKAHGTPGTTQWGAGERKRERKRKNEPCVLPLLGWRAVGI